MNVTNGNMYLEQRDYRLRGVGDGLELSAPTTAGIKLGLFGYGGAQYWMSWVVPYGTNLLRLNLDLV